MNAADLLSPASIVPVVVIDDSKVAQPVAETLLSAGLCAIEVTLRTKAALASIEAIASNVPDMLIGAGSIRRTEHFAQVRDAGARFAVCPGSSAGLLDAADAMAMPFVPGATTATESLELWHRGYTLQKFFPAELAGGAAFLKALSGPLPEVSFMPTGGITPDNAGDYLALDNVACLGGSWIVPQRALLERDFDAIGTLARTAAKLV